MSTKYIASNWRLPNEENSNKSDNYGLSFDGSEYIDTNDNTLLSSNDWSISVWFKWSSLQSGNNEAIVSTREGSVSLSSGFDLYLTNNDTILRARTYSNGVGAEVVITLADEGMTTDVWYHASVVYGSGTLYFKINNGDIFSGSSTGNYTASTNNFLIGKWAHGANYHSGSISEVAVFDYALSSTQISTLYGSSSLGAGNPMALKPQPVAYYPLGDNSASNPLTQPNEAVEDASVFDFVSADGDRILCSPTATVGTGLLNSINGAISISLWIKTTQSSVNQYPMLRSYLGGTNRDWEIRQRSDTNLFHIYFFNTSGTQLDVELTGSTDPQGDAYIVTNDGNWHNVLVVYDGTDTAKIYVDGILQGSNTSASFGTLRTNARTTIGGYNNSGNPYAGAGSWNGQISNAVVWNSDQSSEKDNIYNSGVPATSYTNTPTAWYKLDQSANWEADTSGNWQIPDAVSAYAHSFDFDNSNTNYISVSNDSSINFGTNDHTISSWINVESLPTSSAQYRTIFSKRSASTTDYQLSIGQNGVIYSYNGAATCQTGSGVISAGSWFNVVLRCESNTIQIYVNGVNQTLTGTTTSGSGNTEPLIIGNRGSSPNVNEGFLGKISNVQVFNTTLPATGTDSIETLYNNGVPLTTAIASDNLKLWAKLDNTATFSTNWNIPDASGNGNTGTSSGMTEQNLVNNNVSVLNGESSGMTSANLVLSDLTRAVPYGDGYSFNFDAASSDYIQLASSSTAIVDWTQPYSISLWVKYSTSLTWDLMATFGVETGSASTTRYIMIGGNQGYLFTGVGDTDGGGTTIKFNIGSGLNDDNWHHLVYIGDGSSGDFPIVYIDGVVASPSGGTTGLNNSSTYLNVIGTGSDAAGRYFNGKISNVSIFNEALTSTEVLKLYSNGVPQDLTNFTPAPVAWYTLGSNSFWNGSQWTVRDMIGSNDGTGQNIGIDGLVGDAPRSSANGTGTNMDIPTNLEGSTKWSDNNSWSINMSSTARVEDTP